MNEKISLLFVIIILITGSSCKKISKDCIDKTKINTNCNCPQYDDPVCGCNKKTYSNSCAAECAGVTSYKKGKCKLTLN